MKPILALFCAASLAANAQVLSLEAAQRRALEHSRQLQAHDAAGRAAREMALAAGALPDPVLRVGVDNVPAEGGDKFSLTRDFMTMRRVGVMQELTRGEKRELRRDRYEREAEKVAAERAASAAAVERDTALAWLERHYVEAMVAAADDFVRASEAEVSAADAAYRAGRGSQGEVLAARSMLALAADRRADLARRMRAARIELARWTGGDPGEPLAPRPEMGNAGFPATALEHHLASHPQIVALDRQVDVAAAESRLAAASRHPDWTWEATWQQRGPAYSNMFSVGVSVPLPWDTANRQDREVAAKLALADEARARRDEQLRVHVAEVRALFEEWEAGQDRRRRYREEILPLARERTAAVLAAYAGGRAGLGEVMASRRGELEAALQSLQLDLEVARAWARLRFLVAREK